MTDSPSDSQATRGLCWRGFGNGKNLSVSVSVPGETFLTLSYGDSSTHVAHPTSRPLTKKVHNITLGSDSHNVDEALLGFGPPGVRVNCLSLDEKAKTEEIGA